ncbi:MAG: hypothetical protein LQ347_005192 [Umbilicaria vellea]|nr:MAG: hypothetical protein LQ347_005192 [Umbilicaria vellea]
MVLQCLQRLELLRLAGCLSSQGDQSSSNPTRAITSSTPKSSANHQSHNSSSVENNTGKDNIGLRDAEDFTLLPKFGASGSIAPTVAENVAEPESVPSTSRELGVGHVVNADSKTVRVLQEQWASLDKQEQEIKREIKENDSAVEAHLQECEESDDKDA